MNIFKVGQNALRALIELQRLFGSTTGAKISSILKVEMVDIVQNSILTGNNQNSGRYTSWPRKLFNVRHFSP